MGVTFPEGFRAAGVTAGLKASGRPDVAVVLNDGPAYVAAGVFTSNRVAAAPVHVSRAALADGTARGVLLNSGCANACTGAAGAADTRASVERFAARLGADPSEVLVCSTGMIGERLPMEKLLAGIDAAVAAADSDGGEEAAEAIMTTDTRAKEATYVADGWSVGGMAKGAGMLAPALATMLVVLTTDARCEPAELQAALREATRLSFDRIDSDGCMSTNDSVLVLANGASDVAPGREALAAALTEVCQDLARQLIGDAEGAEHDIAVTVSHAASEDDALEVARAVTRSNLVKTAIFGRDPNWGRIVSQVGTTAAAFDPDTLDVTINGVTVCRDSGVGDDRSLVDLSGRDVRIDIDLKAGEASATVWTNDLTHGYVHENSAYSS